MKPGRIAVIAGVVSIVAIIVIAAMLQGAYQSKRMTISALSTQAQGEQYSLEMTVKDSSNSEIAVPGTVSYVLRDDQGEKVFSKDFNVSSDEFRQSSIAGVNHQRLEWNISYTSITQLAPTKNLTITVTFLSELGRDTKSIIVPIPAILKHLSPLYYEVGEPKDFSSMFNSSQVSGAMVYEPYASELISMGYGKALLWSKDVWPGHPYYALVFNKQWAEANSDLAKRMIKVNDVATDWINRAKANNQSKEYSELIQTAESVLNWNESILRAAIDHIQYKSGMSELAMGYYKNITDGYMAEGLINSSMITALGYKNSSEFINQEVNTTRVSESQDVQESSTILGTVRLGFVANNIHQLARAVAMNASLWGGKSLYERYGLSIVTPQPNGYPSSSSVMGIGLAQNQIDAGYLGACSTILDRTNFGINAFIASEASAEGTALIVNSSITNIGDLANKTIASPGPDTVQQLMLIDLANREWFSLQEKMN